MLEHAFFIKLPYIFYFVAFRNFVNHFQEIFSFSFLKISVKVAFTTSVKAVIKTLFPFFVKKIRICRQVLKLGYKNKLTKSNQKTFPEMNLMGSPTIFLEMHQNVSGV